MPGKNRKKIDDPAYKEELAERRKLEEEYVGPLSLTLAKEEEETRIKPMDYLKQLFKHTGGIKGLADAGWATYQKAQQKGGMPEVNAYLALMRLVNQALENQPPPLRASDLSDEQLFRICAYCYLNFDYLAGVQGAQRFGQGPPTSHLPDRNSDRPGSRRSAALGAKAGGASGPEAPLQQRQDSVATEKGGGTSEVESLGGESADPQGEKVDTPKLRQHPRGNLEATLNGWSEDVPGVADGA